MAVSLPSHATVALSCGARAEYFAGGVTSNSVTDHCLADLKLGKAGEDIAIVKALLASLPDKNLNGKKALETKHAEQQDDWCFRLRQGFSLLFYGFGSKHQLLEKFAEEKIHGAGILAVNGLAPTVSAKGILLQATCMLARAPVANFRGMTAEALLHQLKSNTTGRRLCVILHNIEGPGLRSEDAQTLLSELAACACIFFMASMDHVNTALLWDKKKDAAFNWLWLDVTNYAPYSLETAHMPSILVARREESNKAGAAVVLRTLVPNARAVFRMLADQQMDDEDRGITFSMLFRKCRERFLVSNEQALRAHLTEFMDHELVQSKRGPDGSDLLYCPLDDEHLATVLEEMDVTA